MLVVIAELTLRIPQANGLKDKRRVLKSMLNKTRNKFNVSIAEVGEHDRHQTSIVGFALVSNSRVFLDKSSQAIITFIEEHFPLMVVSTNIELV